MLKGLDTRAITYQLIQTFKEKSSELYSLAFLLTGNGDRSVEAFNRALDFEAEENAVLCEFMNSWGRKLIVAEALGAMETELRTSRQRVARAAEDKMSSDARWKRRTYIAREEFEKAVIAIDAFPRCAMLLTIFEGMSIQAASVLLNADEALARAAQAIGIVQLTRNLAEDSGRGRRAGGERWMTDLPSVFTSKENCPAPFHSNVVNAEGRNRRTVMQKGSHVRVLSRAARTWIVSLVEKYVRCRAGQTFRS